MCLSYLPREESAGQHASNYYDWLETESEFCTCEVPGLIMSLTNKSRRRIIAKIVLWWSIGNCPIGPLQFRNAKQRGFHVLEPPNHIKMAPPFFPTDRTALSTELTEPPFHIWVQQPAGIVQAWADDQEPESPPKPHRPEAGLADCDASQ